MELDIDLVGRQVNDMTVVPHRQRNAEEAVVPDDSGPHSRDGPIHDVSLAHQGSNIALVNSGGHYP
jgi:hypothetical protein